MSKIGRKPINLTNVKVELKGQEVHINAKGGSVIHVLPKALTVQMVDDKLLLQCNEKTSEAKALWGLHRALLANAIKGVTEGFAQKLIINGLGFKASLAGNKVSLNLGFELPRELVIPQGIILEIDKTGQQIIVKGSNKELVGYVASKIREQRPPEPYKGTGIKLENEVILRKAGKTKSA